MKGSEHLFEEVKLKPTNSSNTMFSKLHSSLLTHHNSFQHQETHNNNNNLEDDDHDRSPSSGGGATVAVTGDDQVGGLSKKIKVQGGGYSGGGDGASIEVSRRGRGRPSGSKNKPKPAIIITREKECAMRPHIIEISSGVDIIDSILGFCRQRNIGVCVLTASGSILNVSLRQPTTGATVTFHGHFDILSISATYLPPSSSSSSNINNNTTTISLAGPQGQIFGGSVVGALIASSNVFIVSTSFTTPTYHRLPYVDVEDEEQVPNNNATETTPQVILSAGSVGGGVVDNSGAAAMTIFNCTHLPNDVIWTPHC